MKVQDLFLMAIFYLSYLQLVKGQTLPNCTERCGDVILEYPFGLSPGCFLAEDPSFRLTCANENLSFNGYRVVNISHSSQLRILFSPSNFCFNNVGYSSRTNYIDDLGNLTVSDKNMLTAIGCSTVGLLDTYGVRNYSVGCVSTCDSSLVQDNECNGQGCCQTPVPGGRYGLKVRSYLYNNGSSKSSSTMQCMYAFLVENGTFQFNGVGDFEKRNVTQFPVVLDWSIPQGLCRSLCSVNSVCLDSTARIGSVVCKCRDGYNGNPYLRNGCQDINECTTQISIHIHNCTNRNKCRNTPGSYYCKCKSGFHSNETRICEPIETPGYFKWTRILLGTTIGFLVILLVASCIKNKMKHRKDDELREQYFQQNGGGMLMQRLSGAGPSNVDVRIFTEQGMKEATNDYDEDRILGQGGQGTVYKGIFPDNSIVAIKRSRLGDSSQVEQFINEVLVLSQINHRNVVKLLGCCLETEVPLLVYEFISSGTLFDHLHGSMSDSSLTWEHRLRIAIEIAGSLSYLHSSASVPIIHRDVKTANILLDENLTAKVADFGASRLIPMDKEQLTTMVQGTLGYLDPEYYNTGLLNEKSDVYSFGVVLMELLSGQKALCFERPQNSKHVVSYFASATKENRLHEIIDGQVMTEDNKREIYEAARIALECTRVTGEERPKMKEVASELEAIGVTKNKHQWSNQYPSEREHLLGVDILSAQGETSSTGYDSIKNVAILDIEAGR